MGILIENVFMGNNIQSVVGVGININQTQFEKVNFEATSLSLLNNKENNIEDVLIELLNLLQKDLQKIHIEAFQTITEQTYNEYLFRINEPHTYYLYGEKVQGVIIGVDGEGCLVFKPELSAEVLHLEHGSIKFCI